VQQRGGIRRKELRRKEPRKELSPWSQQPKGGV